MRRFDCDIQSEFIAKRRAVEFKMITSNKVKQETESFSGLMA